MALEACTYAQAQAQLGSRLKMRKHIAQMRFQQTQEDLQICQRDLLDQMGLASFQALVFLSLNYRTMRAATNMEAPILLLAN